MLGIAGTGLVRRTLGKVMGGEVIWCTRPLPLFAQKSPREGHPETDSPRQRVIRARHGATGSADL